MSSASPAIIEVVAQYPGASAEEVERLLGAVVAEGDAAVVVERLEEGLDRRRVGAAEHMHGLAAVAHRLVGRVLPVDVGRLQLVAQVDVSISLRLQVHTRVNQHIFAHTHASASVNRDPPLNHHGCRQGLEQLGVQGGMSVDTCKPSEQRSRTTQESGEQPA